MAVTVVLVHGAFADASGFGGVIRELRADGISVVAPPNPLRSLSSDAAAIGALVEAIDGPALLVGHCYGGAVITQLSAELDNVAGLVYLAGFGLDVGESCAGVQEPYPQALLPMASVPTPYDVPNGPGGPDLYIAEAHFRETLCADVPADVADTMYVTQRPVTLAALTENATAAGWRSTPSWYLIAADDRAVAPAAQRFMAERMGATIELVAGSHAIPVARPAVVARLIRRALAG